MLHYFDKKSIVAILFIMISQPFIAQVAPSYKLWAKANKAFEYGDYLSALHTYAELYSTDSLNNELNLKLGICNYEIKKYRTFSKKYFDKVSSSAFPEVNYYLGRLNHLEKQYDKAIYNYNQYKYNGGDNEYSNQMIEDLIQKCHTAMYFESTIDKTIKVENLGGMVNTEYPEYAPLIPAEEHFLLFTSRRKNDVWQQTDPLGDYFEDVFVSQKKEGSWQAVTMLDTIINTSVHDACTGISADGEKLLIYRTSKDLRSGDIYESFYTNKQWSSPTLLGSNVNSPDFLETSACYAPDGETVFFSSNRPGGFGGKDLYLAKKLPSGKWGVPFNLGSMINTEYNEDAPFVNPSGDILFFSSEGHKNMGGYDIFKSSYINDVSRFSIPENLGCPVNTVDDDIFFVLNTDASLGYFSSQREGGFGSQDIYSVFFPVNNIPLNAYNIHVYDESNNIIKKVELTLSELGVTGNYEIYKSNEKTGKLLVISKPKEYQVIIQAEGYKLFKTNLILNSENEVLFRLTDKN